ncbi:rRNA maturation RNase YbeY [Candidatus Spongiihabitans sp.]|uniref:rRNA maturation RNase YbeY n=1 Tax=Candidatus Spongiihabitans sp. TaxID=3101308 RepID=UPI003C7B39FD
MTIDFQLAGFDDVADGAEIPGLATIEGWVTETFLAIERAPENLTVRVVNEEEITALNHRYRGQDKPTNVLAFPFESVAEVDYRSLGDIVICFAVVKNESNQQHKTVQSHFAQMVIHGTLHLCGFDHQTETQAAAMEEVEKSILANIGVNNPVGA